MKVVVWGCGLISMRLLDTELKNVKIEKVFRRILLTKRGRSATRTLPEGF